MAYSGFLSDANIARKNKDELITGAWTFDNKTTFTKTIAGTAFAAFLGDIAEYYQPIETEVIPPATLVKINSNGLLTKCKKNDKHIFGIISTKPGIKLNSKKKGFLPVVLMGRVPCRVIGKIKPNDKITTSHLCGVAKKKTLLDALLLKPTIGFSLEKNDNDKEKFVEIFTKAHI